MYSTIEIQITIRMHKPLQNSSSYKIAIHEVNVQIRQVQASDSCCIPPSDEDYAFSVEPSATDAPAAHSAVYTASSTNTSPSPRIVDP